VRSLLPAVTAVLLSSSASFAQFASPTPNSYPMGSTSPLGIPGIASSVGPVGIPMGATELSPGGISPTPFDPTASNSLCLSTGVSSSGMSSSGDYGTTAPSSTFDAAGMNTNSMGGASVSGQGSGTLGLSGSCGQGTSARTASGTSPFPGGGIANPTSGTGIPLGSSEVETPGISPVITSPVASTLPGLGTLPPPAGSTLVFPGQPTGASREYGHSTAAGSGGLATNANDFQALGTSTAAGAGGLATESTNRQTFGYSTGAGPGATPTGPTLR
jgi:hypothetical protein